MVEKPKYKNIFRLNILSPKRLVFEGEVSSVFVSGDESEYELLAYHFPLVGILNDSEIIIDGEKSMPFKSAIVSFFANECTMLVEEHAQPKQDAEE